MTARIASTAKPRIKLMRGHLIYTMEDGYQHDAGPSVCWACSLPGGKGGGGFTPKEAFAAWQRVNRPIGRGPNKLQVVQC